MSFSIKNLRNQSAFMTVLHPATGEPMVEPTSNTEAQIECIGVESKQFLNRVSTARKDKPLKMDFEHQVEFLLDAVNCAVVGWNAAAAELFKDEFDGDGSYTAEKAKKLFAMDDYYFLAKQVDKFLTDKTRFFKTA